MTAVSTEHFRGVKRTGSIYDLGLNRRVSRSASYRTPVYTCSPPTSKSRAEACPLSLLSLWLCKRVVDLYTLVLGCDDVTVSCVTSVYMSTGHCSHTRES